MKSRGRSIRISVLHCGHSILRVCPSSPGLGLSSSAIHSRRHSSCASREHGQGLRHKEVFAGSSPSSCWQIQHFRGSALKNSTVLLGSLSALVEDANVSSSALSMLGGWECMRGLPLDLPAFLARVDVSYKSAIVSLTSVAVIRTLDVLLPHCV